MIALTGITALKIALAWGIGIVVIALILRQHDDDDDGGF